MGDIIRDAEYLAAIEAGLVECETIPEFTSPFAPPRGAELAQQCHVRMDLLPVIILGMSLQLILMASILNR